MTSFLRGISVHCAISPVADVAVQPMQHFPNALSLTVEVNHISLAVTSTNRESDRFRSLPVPSLLAARDVVWQWPGLSQTMESSFRGLNNSTWHLTPSMSSHRETESSVAVKSDWALEWPWAPTEAVAWLDPIPGSGIVKLESSLTKTPDLRSLG